MSPEQLMGKQLDGRSDIYAVGVVGYELLTGRLPFPDAQGPAALIAAQLRRTPEPPGKVREGIPPGVDHVILKMLEKDRAKRFNDAGELRQVLLAVLGTGGAVPVQASAPQALVATPPPHTATPPPDAAMAFGKLRAPEAPSTEQAMDASGGSSKLWIWVVLIGILVGGAIGAYVALGR
jgi:serine/threonine-protein kinase